MEVLRMSKDVIFGRWVNVVFALLGIFPLSASVYRIHEREREEEEVYIFLAKWQEEVKSGGMGG